MQSSDECDSIAKEMSDAASVDLLGLLRRIGLVDGQFDGQRVVRTREGHLLRSICLLNFAFILMRFLAYPLLPPGDPLQFLLGNFLDFLDSGNGGGVSRHGRIVTYGFAIFFAWELAWCEAFGRLCAQSNGAHWMRFLSSDRFPSQMAGITSAQLQAYRQRSSADLLRMRRWFLRVCPAMMVLQISGYHLGHTALPAPLFWPVYLANSAYTIIAGTHAMFFTMITPTCMLHLCRLLSIRFGNVGRRLERLSCAGQPQKQPNLQISAGQTDELRMFNQRNVRHTARRFSLNRTQLCRLRFAVQAFNRVWLDLLRINHFWSRLLCINYFFGLGAMMLGAFGSYAARQPAMMVCIFLMASCNLTGFILVPIVFASRVTRRIKTSYRPAKKLLLLQVPPVTKLRLTRILESIQSDRCGFTCWNMFLMKRTFIFETFRTITLGFMLAFEMVYFKGT